MSKSRLFGTDGIRAAFGSYPLDRTTVVRLGALVGRRLIRDNDQPQVVLGGDTRDSTHDLCSWLALGLAHSGVPCLYAGVVPSPAIAFLVREHELAAGIAVSASHNLHPDNGIKLIDRSGFKWSVDAERSLEKALLDEAHDPEIDPPEKALNPDSRLSARYFEALAASLPAPKPLDGLRLVLDTANGAASELATPLFESLGAHVTTLFDKPDGSNINRDCGSTNPEAMARRTTAEGAHLGIAFDGDADRALIADETGKVWDGDAILYLWARGLQQAEELSPSRIVATSMSNLGLEQALREHGVEVVRCDVGDRVVVETMRRDGIRLGGEQSGHIVDLQRSTTGDGLVTALTIAHGLKLSGRPLSDRLAGFRRLPQILQGLRVERKPDLESLPSVVATSRRIRDELGDQGRLVLRYSGTEPLARVMIEGPDQATIEDMAHDLLAAISHDLRTSMSPEE